MSLLIVTGSHASGPQGEFGVWGSEKVYFQVKHDPWSQEPTELCCHSDWTGDPISLKNPKHKTSGTFSFGTRFVICAPKQFLLLSLSLSTPDPQLFFDFLSDCLITSVSHNDKFYNRFSTLCCQVSPLAERDSPEKEQPHIRLGGL